MVNYSKNFFNDQKQGSFSSAQEIVPIVMEMVSLQSVVDVGCGLGTWLSVFLKNGVKEILGVDGSYVDKNDLYISQKDFIFWELEKELILQRKFDLAVSLEVAEHLSPERAKSFVRDLTRLAPIVLFSAAVPGQGGTNHVNEQWLEYWINLFKLEGYIPVDAVRDKIWLNDKVEWWYAQNIIFFVDKKKIAEFPRLQEVSVVNGFGSKSVVHPKLFLKAKDFFLLRLIKKILR